MTEKENSRQSEFFAKWEFCPRCGTKIPKTEKIIRYCFSCGLEFEKYPYIIEKAFPPSVSYKLTEEELDRDREAAPWSTRASLGWPILSIFIMNSVAVIPLMFIVFLIPDLTKLMDLISSPMFLIIFSVTEFVFLIVPLFYVGKYLNRSTLKNRLKVLGIYIEKPHNFFIIKELLLGIGFAIIGFFMVNLISALLEFLFASLFIPSSFFSAQTPSVDMDSIISLAGPVELVLLVIVMIGVIGLSEEVAFRGFMQKGLVKNHGKGYGIWITAIIFALIHVVTIFLSVSPLSILISFLILFPPYLFLSLLLGYLFYWRNSNLIAPIIAHGVYNAITVILVFIIYQSFAFLIPFFLILAALCGISFCSYFLLNRYSKAGKDLV